MIWSSGLHFLSGRMTSLHHQSKRFWTAGWSGALLKSKPLRRQRQGYLCEVKASPIYIASSRTVKTTSNQSVNKIKMFYPGFCYEGVLNQIIGHCRVDPIFFPLPRVVWWLKLPSPLRETFKLCKCPIPISRNSDIIERGALCIKRKALTTSKILSSRSSMLETEGQICLGWHLILYVCVCAHTTWYISPNVFYYTLDIVLESITVIKGLACLLFISEGLILALHRVKDTGDVP